MADALNYQDEDQDLINALLEEVEPEELEGTASLDDRELKQLVEAEIDNAIGYDSDQVTKSRADALDYYTLAPRGDERRGFSQVQSSDVADTVEWMLPETVRLFTDPASCTFLPTAPGKEQEADEQTLAVRKEVYGNKGTSLLLYQWFKDALLQKNGLVKIHYAEKTTVKAMQYSGLNQDELQVLMDDDRVFELDFAERMEQIPTPPEMIQQAMMQAQQMGIPPQVAQSQVPLTIERTVYDASVVVHVKKGDICMDPVPPEEFLINSDHASILLDDARFVDHYRTMPRSDLVALGYDKEMVDNLAAFSSSTQSEEKEARNRLQDTGSHEEEYSGLDRSQEEIEVHECYMLLDYDGDGIAERRRVVLAGGEVIDNDYWDGQPFCALSPFVMPHKFFGLSIFDRIKEVQDIKTTILRQWMDNLYASNNYRTEVVVGQVNLDDLLSPRPGGVVRVKQPGSVREILPPMIGDSALQALTYQDKVRGERSGINPDQKSEGMDIGGGTAHGLERLMTAKEELQWMIGELFAETGIKQMYLKVRDLLKQHRQGPMQLSQADGWRQVTPGEWSDETECSVKVGAGMGERSRKIAVLMQLHGTQMQLMANPATALLVNPQGVYGLLEDVQRLSDINPEQSYFVDPMSQQGQQAAQQQAQAQQMMQQMQQQMQQMQAQLQQALAQAEMQKSQAAMAQAETKRLEAELAAVEKQGKAALEARKLAQADSQHLDRLQYDYTKLEVEQDTDIPGQGMGQ